jgi:hypothetical protein
MISRVQKNMYRLYVNTAPFYAMKLNIPGFGYLCGVLEPNPHIYLGLTLGVYTALCSEWLCECHRLILSLMMKLSLQMSWLLPIQRQHPSISGRRSHQGRGLLLSLSLTSSRSVVLTLLVLSFQALEGKRESLWWIPPSQFHSLNKTSLF